MQHELKTVQPFFDDVLTGKKKFEVRKNDRCFDAGAKVTTWHSHSDSVFAIRRTIDDRDMLCVMNFADREENVHFDYFLGEYKDLFTSRVVNPGLGFKLDAYEYMYLVKIN